MLRVDGRAHRHHAALRARPLSPMPHAPPAPVRTDAARAAPYAGDAAAAAHPRAAVADLAAARTLAIHHDTQTLIDLLDVERGYQTPPPHAGGRCGRRRCPRDEFS